jgi:hypothetical protein
MSFSECIKCGKMVSSYQKYCDACVTAHGVRQDETFHQHFKFKDYAAECEAEFAKDAEVARMEHVTEMSHHKQGTISLAEVRARSKAYFSAVARKARGARRHRINTVHKKVLASRNTVERTVK